MNQPIQLIPEYRDYVWGGDKLRPGFVPTAEAWAVYENDRVAAGPWAGASLAELSAQHGANLLGKYVHAQTGGRFPLLIKLLDCAQWLSVQVHPDDAQAVSLEGPGFFGKTEAWHVLGAEPGAKLIAGVKAGVSAIELAASISDGTILSLSQYVDVNVGDTIYIRPGTIHALGPGLLIYEVQQSSDLTYRVYDWGRPQNEKRRLHIDKSLAVSNPQATVQPVADPVLSDGGRQVVVHNSYFKLEVLAADKATIELDTARESFHVITLIDGQAQVSLPGRPGAWQVGRFETILIPADCGIYRIEPLGAFRALKSSVEPLGL